jgi:hypothetical protein
MLLPFLALLEITAVVGADHPHDDSNFTASGNEAVGYLHKVNSSSSLAELGSHDLPPWQRGVDLWARGVLKGNWTAPPTVKGNLFKYRPVEFGKNLRNVITAAESAWPAAPAAVSFLQDSDLDLLRGAPKDLSIEKMPRVKFHAPRLRPLKFRAEAAVSKFIRQWDEGHQQQSSPSFLQLTPSLGRALAHFKRTVDRSKRSKLPSPSSSFLEVGGPGVLVAKAPEVTALDPFDESLELPFQELPSPQPSSFVEVGALSSAFRDFHAGLRGEMSKLESTTAKFKGLAAELDNVLGKAESDHLPSALRRPVGGMTHHYERSLARLKAVDLQPVVRAEDSLLARMKRT